MGCRCTWCNHSHVSVSQSHRRVGEMHMISNPAHPGPKQAVFPGGGLRVNTGMVRVTGAWVYDGGARSAWKCYRSEGWQGAFGEKWRARSCWLLPEDRGRRVELSKMECVLSPLDLFALKRSLRTARHPSRAALLGTPRCPRSQGALRALILTSGL
jgi:hypothetical protein